MSVVSRRNAVVIGSLLLLCSLGFGGWTALTTGTMAGLTSIYFPAGTQVGYACGSDPAGGATIVKTTDGGNTWTTQNPMTMQGLNSIYFTDANNGYAVGNGGTAVRTTDGGTTWTRMTIPGSGKLNYVQFPGNGQTGYIGLSPQSGKGQVLKTTDGGSTWDSLPVGGAMNSSFSLGMSTALIGVCVGKGGMAYGTTDGFATASSEGPMTIADLVAAAFSSADPTKGYLIGNDTAGGTPLGVIRYTADEGVSLWDSVTCPVVTSLNAVTMATADVGYICGDSAGSGFILRSVSPTDFWRTTVPTGTGTVNGVCFPNGSDTGYACGGGGTILRTYDGGIPLIPGVAEGKVPAVIRTGIRVASNPCRHGIALHSDAGVRVTVFDAAGRAVMSQAATKGLNFLPLPTGAYFVKAGAQTARAVVTD